MLENEQLNLLPNILTNIRTQNSFITTDRPDSAQVDFKNKYQI
jgi:hypothetical protein